VGTERFTWAFPAASRSLAPAFLSAFLFLPCLFKHSIPTCHTCSCLLSCFAILPSCLLYIYIYILPESHIFLGWRNQFPLLVMWVKRKRVVVLEKVRPLLTIWPGTPAPNGQTENIYIHEASPVNCYEGTLGKLRQT